MNISSSEVFSVGVSNTVIDKSSYNDFCFFLYTFGICPFYLQEKTSLLRNWHDFAMWLLPCLRHLVFLCCGVHIFINICNGFNCFLSYPCIIADCFIAESKNNEMPKAFCRVRSAFWHNYSHDLDYGHGLHHKLTCLSTCAPTIYHIRDIESVLAVLRCTEKYFHCFGDFTYWIWIFQL